MMKIEPEWALHKAAQCWCKPTTSHLVMEPALCEVFAAELAAAVAEERERCAQIVENGPFAGTRAGDAAAIRGMK
jgi:hypothetical protein